MKEIYMFKFYVLGYNENDICACDCLVNGRHCIFENIVDPDSCFALTNIDCFFTKDDIYNNLTDENERKCFIFT